MRENAIMDNDAAFQRLDREAQQQRADETLKLIVAALKDLKAKSVSKQEQQELDDLKEAIQLAIDHDVAEFNDKKRDRYAKIIGSALRGEKQVDGLASYIQDVERLGERDHRAPHAVITTRRLAKRPSVSNGSTREGYRPCSSR